ncbi:MAG: choice-of-anchor D domain-containing protein [bacterium]|nr:choice-of-anchor D domain-containing protein [Candidatus Kapabacteria bacterium]
MRVRHVVLPFLLALLAIGSAAAQTLIVYNVDASGFPTIKANFIVLDSRGNRIPSVNTSDFVIDDNGFPGTDITVTCPPFTTPQPFNAVLVNDKSGSMWMLVNDATSRLDLAKLGSSEFVQLTNFAGGSSIAVTSFESRASIVADFQTSRQPLLDAISTIKANGGTLYNPPFLDAIAGAIGMLKTRPDNIRRVIVFLTDGEPNEPTLVNQIVNEAVGANIEVYTVTIGMPMTPELRAISERTNGEAFGDIWTVDQIRGVYQQIAVASGGSKACEITWRSRISCGESSRHRKVAITYKPNGATGSASYIAPASSVGGITATPSFVNFGSVGPPDSLDRQIVISSPNDSMRIDRIDVVPIGTFRVVDWGGTPPPIRQAKGTTRRITVRFAPADSQKYVASLVVFGAPCPPYPITLTGGVGRDDGTALKLLSPLGGEMFSDCDSVLIRWGGVSDTTAIKIESSSDDGLTWKTITRSATGLAYRWMPPAAGNKWRIRISVENGEEQHIITTVAGGGGGRSNGLTAKQLQLYSPTGVLVSQYGMWIAEAGGHYIWFAYLPVGRVPAGRAQVVAGTGNPGYNSEVVATLAELNGPSHIVTLGSYLFLADRENHRVRRINFDARNIPYIATIAGTGESGFKGDGAGADTAVLQFPTYLAARGTSLYVSDVGNNRIRKIDIGSGIITTVVGGGATTAEEVRATDALLNGPAGIAVDDRYLYFAETGNRRIRRVDLTTNILTTVAGTGMDASTGDGGQAWVATFKRPVGVAVVGSTLYVTDSEANRVRKIDLVSGIINAVAGTGAEGFSGDSGDARLATMAGPGQPSVDNDVLFVPDIRNNRIRAITIAGIPTSDSSRAPFTVSVASLRVGGLRNDVFAFGRMAVGQPLDSSVAGVLCSVGDRALVIDSARVIGAHASDFAVVSGAPSSPIDTGTCAPLEVRFRPSALGLRSATIVLYGRCANIDTVFVTGIGVDTCGIEFIDLADVGEITLGANTRDTIIVRAICNTAAQTMIGNATIASGAHAFQIVAGGGTFMLRSGECHTVTVHFAPTISGRVTGEIDYGVPSVCGIARTQLYGRALGAPEIFTPAFVVLDTLVCGATRDSAIVINNTGGAPLIITSATFVANLEGFSMLPPLPTATSPLTILPGESALLAVRFAPASSGDKSGTLELISNAVGSPHRISIVGRRDVVDVRADQLIAFPADAVAVPRDTLVTITNNGTFDITVNSITLAGLDAASYDVPAGQTPLTIASGSSATVLVRLITAPVDRAVRAQLVLAYGPNCDSGRIHVELIAAGTGPDLLSFGPTFNPLICADETSRDTIVTILSAGSTPLVIDGATITNDAGGAFSVVFTQPITVAEGEDTTIAVRFAPVLPGDYTAELRISSNVRDGITIIPLSGRRESVVMAASPSSLTLGPLVFNSPADASVDITNSGTVPLDMNASSARGIVDVTSQPRFTIAPGMTSTVAVRFDASIGGRTHDTIIVLDELCGTTLRIPIQMEVILPLAAHITLPHEITRPGHRVSLPIRISITDAALFATRTSSTFSATISMYGTVLVADGVLGGTIVANSYDMKTRKQTVRFHGEYVGNDTVAWLLGRALLGDTLATPLWLDEFRFSDPIGVTSTNGSVSVVGTCLDIGLRIVATPAIVKLRPMPMSDHAMLELTADEWINARIVLYDSRGISQRRRCCARTASRRASDALGSRRSSQADIRRE